MDKEIDGMRFSCSRDMFGKGFKILGNFHALSAKISFSLGFSMGWFFFADIEMRGVEFVARVVR